MNGFFRRPLAMLAALLLLAGLVPSVSIAQQDAAKSAPPVLIPPAEPQAPAAASAPVAPIPAAPVKAGVEKESVENPYGLEALWRQGDFVSKGTLIILVIMSMGSWYILFVKLWEQYKLMREARDVRTA
ncbi:MAG: MotA/TolQ/ExbB proton channel family protein, partial [Pseudomonadota bacterium]|nr:MotA/TolQ/ExbB proton channel family protein [Pseudomonadota bacterium]